MNVVRRFSIPCRVWPVATLPRDWLTELRRALVTEAIVETPAAGQERGPAIVLLNATAVRRSDPDARRLVDRSGPARPILVGGLDDRDVLSEAINHWNVVRAVPHDASIPVAIEAIRAAHEVLEVEVSVAIVADELRDETAKLAAAIQELRTAQTQLLHHERLSTVGRLTGGLLGALRDHQRALQRYDEAMRDDTVEPELRRLTGVARDGVQSIANLLAEMEAYALGEERDRELVINAIDELVSSAVAFARFDELVGRRTLRLETAAGVRSRVDRFGLYHVLLNLIRNALDATPEGGLVEVRTRSDATHFTIEVEDNGRGMSQEVRARMFEPFFTTRGTGGLGLGLRTTETIIRRHRGTIDVRSSEGKGTRVVVRIPIDAA